MKTYSKNLKIKANGKTIEKREKYQLRSIFDLYIFWPKLLDKVYYPEKCQQKKTTL